MVKWQPSLRLGLDRHGMKAADEEALAVRKLHYKTDVVYLGGETSIRVILTWVGMHAAATDWAIEESALMKIAENESARREAHDLEMSRQFKRSSWGTMKFIPTPGDYAGLKLRQKQNKRNKQNEERMVRRRREQADTAAAAMASPASSSSGLYRFNVDQ